MKYIMIKSISLFAFLTLSISCEEEPTIVHNVVVICDTSNSSIQMEGNKNNQKWMLDQLKTYIREIPKCYPLTSNIYYFSLSDNLASRPLGGSAISYNIKYKTRAEEQKKDFDIALEKVIINVDANSKTKQNSCILFSIQRAIKVFQEKKLTEEEDNCHNVNELIIISDMLECCKRSSGTINFDIKGKELDNAITRMDNEKPSFDVSDLDLTVRVLQNTPNSGEDFEKIQAAWQRWFKKIGIKGEVRFCLEFKKSRNPAFKD
ncbi:MAG TPA: hypothetical protein VK498_01420 [Ferruginibacter sp.]|nr:hypothetical protein [Ferruginibacter sp.]